MRARHRVSKLLLRHDELYCGGAAWTGKHLTWLREQCFDFPGTRAAFDADLEAVEFATARTSRPSRRWPPIRSSPTSPAVWGICGASRR